MIDILAWLLVIIFFALSIIFGNEFRKALKVLDDVEDLVHKINESLADGKLSYDEAKEIVTEVIRIIEEFKRTIK